MQVENYSVREFPVYEFDSEYKIVNKFIFNYETDMITPELSVFDLQILISNYMGIPVEKQFITSNLSIGNSLTHVFINKHTGDVVQVVIRDVINGVNKGVTSNKNPYPTLSNLHSIRFKYPTEQLLISVKELYVISLDRIRHLLDDNTMRILFPISASVETAPEEIEFNVIRNRQVFKESINFLFFDFPLSEKSDIIDYSFDKIEYDYNIHLKGGEIERISLPVLFDTIRLDDRIQIASIKFYQDGKERYVYKYHKDVSDASRLITSHLLEPEINQVKILVNIDTYSVGVITVNNMGYIRVIITYQHVPKHENVPVDTIKVMDSIVYKLFENPKNKVIRNITIRLNIMRLIGNYGISMERLKLFILKYFGIYFTVSDKFISNDNINRHTNLFLDYNDRLIHVTNNYIRIEKTEYFPEAFAIAEIVSKIMIAYIHTIDNNSNDTIDTTNSLLSKMREWYHATFIMAETGTDEFIRVNKLKRLQNVDPVLFNYHKGREEEEITPYSVVCQKNAQPLVLQSKQEVEDFKSKNPDFTYALPIRNKTIPDVTNYYVCNNHPYLYPGLIEPIKHPDGFCMVCCKKKDPRIPGSKNYKIMQKCLKLERGEGSVSETTDTSKSIANKYYVRQKFTPSKILNQGNLQMLPPLLDSLFNDPEDYVLNNTNTLQRPSKIYVLMGTDNNESILSAIITSFVRVYGKFNTEVMMKIMLDQVNADYNVFMNSTDIEKISYLETISGVNIVIIDYDTETDEISFVTSSSVTDTINNLTKVNSSTCIIVRSMDSRSMYYFPLINMNLHLDQHDTVEFRFDHNDKAVRAIVEILNNLIETSDLKKDEHPNLIQLGRIMNENEKYQITKQILDETGRVSDVVINDKFIFPVVKSIPSESYEYYEESNISNGNVVKFWTLVEFMRSIGNKLSVKHIVIDPDYNENTAVGVILNTGFTCKIKPEEINEGMLSIIKKEPKIKRMFNFKMSSNSNSSSTITAYPTDEIDNYKAVDEIYWAMLMTLNRDRDKVRDKIRDKIRDKVEVGDEVGEEVTSTELTDSIDHILRDYFNDLVKIVPDSHKYKLNDNYNLRKTCTDNTDGNFVITNQCDNSGKLVIRRSDYENAINRMSISYTSNQLWRFKVFHTKLDSIREVDRFSKFDDEILVDLTTSIVHITH